MLLHASDWQRYPTALVDYSTSNSSFLHLVRVLHEMGVQNCLFPLALIDPRLQGVDPYSKTLTLDQKSMVAVECLSNFWYFVREVARVPPQAGIEPIQFIANRGNMAVYWLFFNNIDCALIQPRQTGKSTSVDIMMIWLLYIGSANSKIALFTLNDKLRKDNINRLKRARDYLPKYLVPMTPDDADNKFELTCNEYGNRYIAMVGQNSESASSNQGRGGTAPVNQFDEGPFTPFIGDAVPAALAAGVAVRREAERNGRPYGNIFTTTAGKKDDRDGSFMHELINSGADWTDTFYDAGSKAALIELIKQNGSRGIEIGDATERSVLVNITMSHRQLGYTDQWMAETLAMTKSKGDKADRDFFNRWTSGSQHSPLTIELNEIIRNSEREVLWTERSRDGYLFRWYIPKDGFDDRMASGHYILGLDTSDAGPGDGVSFVMTDAKDLSTAGAGTYTETNLLRLGTYFCEFMVKYPNTTLIIERKSSGQAIIDILLTLFPKYGIDPFKRMFNMVVEEKDERQEDWKEIQRSVTYRNDRFYDGYKTDFGFFTDKNSRPFITEVVLQESAKNAGHLVHDKKLITEILELTIRNGRVDHPPGGHDDHVIAWLMAHWLLTYGHNLSEYGIPPGYALSSMSRRGEQVTEEVMEERRVQEELMEQIDTLTTALENCRDPILQFKMEHKLKTLLGRMSFETREHFSMDDLLRSSAEERKKRQLDTVKPYKPMDRSISMNQGNPYPSRSPFGSLYRPNGYY